LVFAPLVDVAGTIPLPVAVIAGKVIGEANVGVSSGLAVDPASPLKDAPTVFTLKPVQAHDAVAIHTARPRNVLGAKVAILKKPVKGSECPFAWRWTRRVVFAIRSR